MSMTISVTNQWQIYVPDEVRQALAWTRPGKAKVELKGRSMVVTPQKSQVMKLAGKYRHLGRRQKINLDQVRDYIDYSHW